MDGEDRVAAWLILRANVFAAVVEIPLLLAFDLVVNTCGYPGQEDALPNKIAQGR
jgi:hypothetical protein